METLIFASLCVGAAAGVRLRVFVLFPLIIFSSIVVTALGLAQSETGWSIIVDGFCWLSLPSARLFCGCAAKLGDHFQQTKTDECNPPARLHCSEIAVDRVSAHPALAF